MKPTICLNMIVKNESAIIVRCLQKVKHLIDAWCIVDTGSTDNTIELIQKELGHLPGEVIERPWVNFGFNRNEALSLSRHWADWVLLIDADMIVNDLGFDSSMLDSSVHGYHVMQFNRSISYYNFRLLNTSVKWKCTGVTHEFYSCENQNPLIKKLDAIQINDVGDGGAKSDKFERDIRLLLQGLEDEPGNLRYMFYLAQSYRDISEFEKSIEWYKKRVEGGGWHEECWYSYYMISTCYIKLGEIKKAEEWALSGFEYYPKRSEALYDLCKEFRVRGDHKKAYEYYRMGKPIVRPKDDVLFISHDVYDFLFDYELTILHFYLFPEDRIEGLRKSVEFMRMNPEYLSRVYLNLKFYLGDLSSHASCKGESESVMSEKSWPFLPREKVICSWSPLRVFDFENRKEVYCHSSPVFFDYFCDSSSVAVDYNGLLWFVVRSIDRENSVRYMHWLVALQNDGKPVMHSLPFTFGGEKNEYCQSLNVVGDKFEFHYSTLSAKSNYLQIPIEYFSNKILLC